MCEELWLNLDDGHVQHKVPFVTEAPEEVDGKSCAIEAYWGKVPGPGNDAAIDEALTFVPPASQPWEIRKALTRIAPKAKIIPKEKELQAFLKGAWKTPTDQARAKYFVAKKKVVMQLLFFSLKPMTADKRATGMTGTSMRKPIYACNHEDFQVQISTTNALADLL